MFDTHRNNTVGCAEQLQDLEASLTGLASKGIRDSTVMGSGSEDSGESDSLEMTAEVTTALQQFAAAQQKTTGKKKAVEVATGDLLAALTAMVNTKVEGAAEALNDQVKGEMKAMATKVKSAKSAMQKSLHPP